MKILYICESFPTSTKADFTGGVEARDYYTALKLAQNHHVTVITGARQKAPSKQTIGNIRIIRCGSPVPPQDRENLLIRLAFILEAVNQGRHLDFDLIQGSNVVSQAIAGLLGTIKSKPSVSLVADVFLGNWIKNTNVFTGLIGEITERLTLKFPWTQFIAVSLTTKQKLINAGVPSDKITVIHAGVDHQLCQTHLDKYSRPTITYAGRLVDYKRVQDLIQSLKLVKNNISNIKLNIIGVGPKLSELLELTKQLHLENHVEFHGFIDSHQRVIDIIARSHVYASPSIVEGFGLTTIEAMACGTPVVLADTPVTQEVTQGGKGALLFKPKSVPKLAAAIELLLTDKKLHAQKTKQATNYADKFSWHQVSDQTATVYERITHPPLKILLLTEFFPQGDHVEFSGGVEARTYFIHKYLQKNHTLKVISRDKKFVAVSSSSILPRIKFQLFAIYQALKTDFDVIEGSNVTCYLPAFIAAKLKRKKVVAWIPDIYLDIWFKNFKTIPAITGYLLERISLWLPWDHVIAMSHSTQKKLTKAGVSPHRITVVHGGVEVTKLKNLRVNKYHHPTIITLARLVKYKRIQDLIQAVNLLQTDFPQIKLLVLGDGPYKPDLEQLTHSLNLSKHITFKGNLPHQRAMKLLKKATIFSLPSIVEGFGLVTAEAMACGIPYVNSSIPPTIEVTKSGTGGLLFEPQNHQDLAAKIRKLLTDKKFYRSKQQQALKFVTRYDWPTIAEKTQHVYQKVIR